MTSQKQQLYQSAPSLIQYLYDSPEAGAEIYRVFSKYNLDEEIYSTYATSIGDVILGIYTTDQLPKLLETELGIEEATALAIVEDLREFLGPVYDRENGVLVEDGSGAAEELEAADEAAPAPILEKAAADWGVYEAPTNTPDQVPAASTPETAQPETPETIESESPEPSEVITPMRTMEGDMQKIHGYGAYREQFPNAAPEDDSDRVVRSSQDEALTRVRPSLADTPKISDDDTA